ncbi:TauD/TfdA family dioxygenase [Pseudomonas putida]|uniref:TauD/TfdA family dioxygenase n=1 Tax=Pseudomonas putida group TaxID=136845 RepID=UPI0018AB21D3|nr:MULTISPECIES: TauD/TfdA family dioxygenase [Pseudomonas]MBF8672527.1 TauD/TfdA family dioxygenase [Pseudomonas putida]MBF8715609.1 TauD/TfdA family dioxygenase [Pseudomonas putida]MEC4561922.1 TauD/TfdA family dioxygenase [Pseudomonas sp. CMAA1741]
MSSIEHLRGRSVPLAPAPTATQPVTLPMLVQAQPGQSIHDLDASQRAGIDRVLSTVGGILFRGFSVSTPIDFKRFAASFGAPLASYEFGSTPRSKVFTGVYSSTEYPAHQFIPLHNEQAYTRPWPSRIWFHCMKASETGGETPIADSRLVYQRMPTEIREQFASRELLYVRNYSGALDLPWQKVFNTEDRSQVERYCQDNDIEWQWKDDGELQTRQRCAAVLQHPESGEWVWFNQAHLFHVSAIEPSVRASLLAAVGEENLPRHVYFGDGSAIPDALLDSVREVYRQTAISFPWQAGDILMLDNRLVAHGRNPYTGDRKVIVAMA